ncbi:helix-turn-helix domain-containing protein [Streptomyces sp. O3]
MGHQYSSAPSRASSGVPGRTTRSGVVHDNVRHTERYTVVGNHLAQHRELSLLAIGLAVHIQSLPCGAKIGIRFLAARFPESEYRIAAALRELEAHGYLRRTRERLPSGQVVTRTVSCNRPGDRPGGQLGDRPGDRPGNRPGSPSHARSAPARTGPKAPVRHAPAAPAPVTPVPPPAPEPAAPAPVQRAPKDTPPLPLPEPETPDPERLRVAAGLLAELRRHEPRLLLAERDVRRLAPAVEAWLERGAAPDAVRRALLARLPEPLGHPAGLLAHRLTALLPPPLPTGPRAPDPLQTCEECDRAFRAPEPGHCRACASRLGEAA